MATAKGHGNFSITIRGHENLARTLRRAGADIGQMRAANDQAGGAIVKHARILCPVKTGRLQGSIRSKPLRGGVTVVASEGLVYGPVQHWGWPAHNIRATLFLTKGFVQARSEVNRAYQEETRKAMAQVKGV
jgi:hypothetical protein